MSLPRFLSDPDLRLILFGGKGGVGKTTCACAAAMVLAGRFPEKPMLLVSTDPAHSVRDSLGEGGVPPNLEILELETRKALSAFKAAHAEHLREIAMRGTFLDEEDIDRFLKLSLPGMDELLAFMEIAERVRPGGGYECVLVDTAPTGHTLRLLSMPDFLLRWREALDTLLAKHRYMKELFSGRSFRDELDEFLDDLADSVGATRALLEDEKLCRFVPVMLAERLSVLETRRLLRELERLNVPVSELIVNRLYPEEACSVCSAARVEQRRELRRLRPLLTSYKAWGVALYPEEVLGGGILEHFWEGARELSPGEIAGRRGGRRKESSEPAPLTVAVENPAKLPAKEAAFLLFAGKGGVGKTTLACATALRLAQEWGSSGKEILLFSTDPAHSLSDCLDRRIGAKVSRIRPGLSAFEIDAQAEFDAFKNRYRKELERFLSSFSESLDFTFDREVMEKMMDLSPPGLDEVMALTRVMDDLARGSYDLFILDAAPTGHLIRLLELPEMVDQWLKAFFELLLKYRNIFSLPDLSQRLVRISKDLKRLRSLLADPGRSGLYAVSILTRMALEETRDLVAACERMNVAVPVLFLNLATPQSDCRFCSQLHSRESAVREEYRTLFPGTHQAVVYRQAEPRGAERLEALGRALYEQTGARNGGTE